MLKSKITDEVLESAKKLKYIGPVSTGYNTIDIEACKKRDILVANVPAYGPAAVAQHAFSLLLAITNNVSYQNERVKKGDWKNSYDWIFTEKPMIELDNKTMGIIGYGNIGQKMALFAQAAGMKVLANKRNPDYSLENENLKFVSKEEIFRNADVISLHCPLTDENRGMIDKNAIEMMKDGVIIINAARGPLIDEKALIEGLSSGKVRACGLDVTRKEPIEDDNPLLKLDNCFITPHTAATALDTRKRIMALALDNLRAFVNGNPKNIVD